MSSRQEDDRARSRARRLARSNQASSEDDRETPEHIRECLRIRRVVRKLLRRDMKRARLSLRRAAREGHISIGTLSSFVNDKRAMDPAKQPKRGVHRGTILHLRGMRWIGGLTAYALDRLLEADELGHRPRAKDR
jgi:hypothetical protein